MGRPAWLKEKRRLAVERMDTLYAPIYDEQWGAIITPLHQEWYQRFLDLCPPGALILDAGGGTGKYWLAIFASGRQVLGIDQSWGMLSRAQAKYPQARIEKVGLQEMRYQAAFDGASCMDAMELVFPEDWLPVLVNFYRALKPGSYFYFTVELAAEPDIAHAFEAARQMGYPVVYGEWAPEGRYHYYPRIEQVKEWLEQVRFSMVDETADEEYHHSLCKDTKKNL